MAAEDKPNYNPDVLLHEGGVLKTHDSINPELEIAAAQRYYELLRDAGVPVLATPAYRVVDGAIQETQQYVGDKNGRDLLLERDDAYALQYFVETILESAYKVVSSQQGVRELAFSLDPLPQNFVDGNYVDFFPVYLLETKGEDRRFYSDKLFYYAFIKYARIVPHLFSGSRPH